MKMNNKPPTNEELTEIAKQGTYAILTVPFEHRPKSWFTKTGNLSKSGINKFIQKYEKR